MIKKTITFSLSKELIDQLDEYAKEMSMNRSAFLEWLLSNALPMIPAATELLKNIFKVSTTKPDKSLGAAK